MNLSFLDPFRYLYQLFTKDDSPRQLAFGVAMGLTIGLIPKGNLVAATLMALLFAFRTNIGAGLLTICCVSALGTRLDPLLDGIGTRLLSHGTVYQWISRFYEMPLVPWTALNNTVVMGGLVLGAALFYPAYHLSELFFERFYDDAKAAFLRRFRHRQTDASADPVDDEPQQKQSAAEAATQTPIPAPHLAGINPGQKATPHSRHFTAPTVTRTDLPSDVVVDWRRR